MNIKVRLNEMSNHHYKCWLDAETTYYYGRSFVPQYDEIAHRKEADIDEWLEHIGAYFKKMQMPGCLPEWDITFDHEKDLTMFKVKWIN